MPDYREIHRMAQESINKPKELGIMDLGKPVTLGEMGGIQGITRYPSYHVGLDNEDIYGQSQGAMEKWRNGFLKFIATTGTTFAEGTIGLINGIGQALYDGKFSSFYDNELNRSLDRFKNDYLENVLPNYYTNRERDAAWYSPDTWWSANFGADLILKNAGFAVGAYLSGGVWTKAMGRLVATAAGGEILGAGGKLAQSAQKAEQAILLGRDANTLARYERAALEAVSTRFNTLHSNLTFGANAARAGIASISEAGIEARHAKQAYIDEMKQHFIEANGYEPTGAELQRIENLSDKVGGTTFTAGVALLTATNYIQFPKLAGRVWRAERAAMSGAERGLGRMGVANAQGKIVSRSARALQPGEQYVSLNATTKVGEIIGRTKVGRGLNRISPWARILASPSEGFEEGMQEVISSGSTDFYAKGYKGEDTDFFQSFREGIKQTLTSKDGQLAIMSGLLTGGLMENVASPLMGGKFGHSVKHRNKVLANTQSFVNKLNSSTGRIGNYMQEMNNSLKRSIEIDRASEGAIINGDRLNYEDAEMDASLNYLLPRVQYGRTDLVQADIDAQRAIASTEDGFSEMKANQVIPQDITREEYLNNLDKLERTLNTVESHFEALNTRYGSLKKEDGSQQYTPTHLFKMAYTASKIDDYNSRISSLYSSFNRHGISVMDLAQQTLNEDVDNETLTQEFNDLKEEIHTKVTNPELAEDMLVEAGDIVELTLRRNEFVKDYESLRTVPETSQEESLSLGEMEDDPLDQVERRDDIDEVLDEQLRDIAHREFEGGEISPEEQIIALENEDVYQEYLQTLRDAQPSPKRKFFEENSDSEFFMEVDGELVQDKLEYSDRTGILSFGGMEVTAQDFNSGTISSDDTLSDTLNYLSVPDSREAVVQQKRIVKILTDRLKQAVKRQNEIRDQLEQKKTQLEQVNNKIKSREKKNSRKGKLAATLIDALRDLAETKSIIEQEIDQLTTEGMELQSHINEYQQLLDSPQESLSATIDLLQRQIDGMENTILENGTLIGQLTNVLTSLNKTIGRLRDTIIEKLGFYTRKNPNDLNAKRALNDIKSGVPSVMEAASQLIEDITGFDIGDAIARERQTANQIDDILSQLNNMDESFRAKSEILDQLIEIQPFILGRVSIVENASEEVITQFEEVEETQDEEVEPPAPTPVERKYPNTEKKPVSTVYQSNAMPPESVRKTDKNYLKWEYFLSKFRLLPDKSSYKTLFVTANNEQAVFGQKGYIDQLYTDNEGNPYYQEGESTEGEDPAVAIVIVKEVLNESTGRYELMFVNKLGQPIHKVGGKVRMSSVVGWKMPSTLETYRESQQDRAYDDAPSSLTLQEKLKRGADEWSKQRDTILASTTIPTPRNFTVSQGSVSRGSRNNPLRNDVVGTLVGPEEVGRRGLLTVISKDVTIGGLKYRKGTVVVAGPEFSEQALPRALSNSEKDNIFNLLLYMAKSRPSGVDALNPIVDYLRGLMRVGSNQPFKFGEAFSSFQIGENDSHEMSAKYLEENKEEIISQLLLLNTNVNRDLLQDNESFQEFLGMENGIPQYTTWNSYQEYILSDTLPDGTPRDPLVKVNVENTEDANPTFKDRYVIVGEVSKPRQLENKTTEEAATELLNDTGLFNEPQDRKVKPKRTTKPKRLPQPGTFSGRAFNPVNNRQVTPTTPINYTVIDRIVKGGISTITIDGKARKIEGKFPDETGDMRDTAVYIIRENGTNNIYTVPTSTLSSRKSASKVEVEEEFTDNVDDIMEGPAAIETEVITPAQIAPKIKPKVKVKTPTVEETQPLPEDTANTSSQTPVIQEQQPQTTPQEVVEPTPVKQPTKTKAKPIKEDFQVGQQATVDNITWEITSLAKYGGFWIGRVENGEVVLDSEIHVSGKKKNSLMYKAFLASQGTFTSDRGPNLPCNG